MYHKDIYRDRSNTVRADLRTAAVRDWDALPVDAHYVWTWVGPTVGVTDPSVTTLPGQLQAEPVAGLVADIAVGSTPDHLALGTRGGGVWRSTDAGAHWIANGDALPSLQTVSVALVDGGADPVLVAGTGELSNEQVRNAGLMGVFRSVDGGRTWSMVDGGMGATIFQSHDINQVVAVDADRILVATRVGLFYSKDGGRNFGQAPDHVDGLPVLRGFVSAVVVDGNEVAAVTAGEPTRGDPVPADLVPQLAAPVGELGLYRAVLSPTNLPNLVLLHRARDTVSDPAVGQTALARLGSAWLMSVATVSVDFNTLAPSTPWPHHSVQFTQDDPASASGWGALPIQVIRDRGGFGQTWYSHAVMLEPPTAPGTPHAWFGTIALSRLRIDRSGQQWTWARDPSTPRNGVHEDQHALRVVTSAPGTVRVLIGNDGGLYQSDDRGSTFHALNDHGAFLFWSLAVARKDPDTLQIIGGAQDNDVLLGEGRLDGTPWNWRLMTALGDGGNVAFIPRAIDRAATDAPDSALVTSSGKLFTAMQSLNWTLLLPETDQSRRTFPFSETVVVGRAFDGSWSRVYFARSETRGGPGTLLRRDFSSLFEVKHTFSAMVTAMAAAPEDVRTEVRSRPAEWGHLWVGLANGELYFSPDGGGSFVAHPTGGTGPITGIAVDPQDSRRVAVVHGGFADPPVGATSGKVFLTEDRGARFRDISGHRGPNGFVPDIPALAVAFTRTTPTQLIVATDLGVLVTTGPRPSTPTDPQFGDRWSRLGVGLPKIPCTGVGVVNENPSTPVPAIVDGVQPLPVAVSTFGRGVWVLTHPTAAQAFIELDGGFGAVAVGATARRTITVHNVGGASLHITAASVPAPFAFDGLPDLAQPILPGGHAQWTVTCSPTAAGIQSTDVALTFDTGAPASPPHVSCEGVTGSRPRMALWPRSINFAVAPAGNVAEQPIVVANRGASDLTITSVTLEPGATTELSLDLSAPPSIVIRPGEERTFTLRFTPSGATGFRRATWTIQSNDPITIPGYWKIQATIGPHPTGLAWGWWVLIGLGIAAGAAGTAAAAYGIYEATRPRP